MPPKQKDEFYPNVRGCPFCNSHDVEIARTNAEACWVECSACGASTQSARTRGKAIANWNERHHDEEPARILYDDDLTHPTRRETATSSPGGAQ